MGSRGNVILAVTFVNLILTQIICDSTDKTVQSRFSKTRTRRRTMRQVFNNFMRFRRALDVLRSRADYAGDVGDTKIYTKTGGIREAMGEFVLLDANDIRQFDARNGAYVKLGNIADDTFVKLNSKDKSVKPPSSTIELWKASSSTLGVVKCVTKIVYKDG